MDVRVDVKIPGGVLAYVIDLRGERYVSRMRVIRLITLYIGLDTTQRLRYGKKRICLHCFALYSTVTIRRTGWRRIDD